MNSFKLLFFLCCLSVTVHGQYVPGKLYVKAINSVGIPQKVNNQWVFSDPSLQTLFNSYGLTNFVRSFPAIDQFPVGKKFGLDSVYTITITGNEANLQNALKSSATTFYTDVDRHPISESTATPNDYHLQDASYGPDWALDNLRAKQAWDLTTGSSSIKIGIVEFGFDNRLDQTHQDIQGKVDFASSNLAPTIPHGTFVAGCAAGATNNGVGKSSIGYNSRLIYFSDAQPTLMVDYNQLLEAANLGARVINCSFLGCFNIPAQQNIINALAARGVIVVGGAGNGVYGPGSTDPLHPPGSNRASCGTGGNGLGYPASYDNAISVSSIGPDNNHWDFTELTSHSHNAAVDICAPGYHVLSTFPGNQYGASSGTSFAAPLTSGVIGLMLAINPCLGIDEIEEIFEDHAFPILDQASYPGTVGSGRVDAREFVAVAQVAGDRFPIQGVGYTQMWLAGNYYVKGDLVIDYGATLHIREDAIVRFAKDAKVVVKRGGTLIVDGGTLTSSIGCSTSMWEGIIVEGNKNASQYTSLAQGTVEIKNGALIENAKEAIRTIRVNANGTLDYSYTGGIVMASGSTFRNNKRCAEFLSFHNPFLLVNKSYFKDCIFETTTPLIDPTITPSSFISQWDVRGITFQGNTFVCRPGSGYTGATRGKGISSIDAIYNVNRNTSGVGNSFINLDVALEITNSTGAPTWTNTIKGNSFLDNRHNVYIAGSGVLTVVNQNFINRTTPAIWSPSSFGLYSTGAKGITVSCNSFSNLTYGSLILATGTASDPVSTVNDNTYFYNYRTLQTQDSNSKLKIGYNDFTPFASTQMHWYNLGLIPAQGTPGAPAANRFLGNPPPNKDIWNTTSANMFIYYYNTPGDANTYPVLNAAGNVLLLNTGVTWTPSTWCTTGGGSGMLLAGGGGSEDFSLADSFEDVTLDAELSGEEAISSEINDYIFTAGLDTNPPAAIEYLAELDNEQADWKLVPYYISFEDYASAADILANLEADDANEASMLNYFRTVNNAGLDGRNLAQLDSAEIAALDILAEGTSEMRENARSILHYFYGRNYPVEEIYVENIPLFDEVSSDDDLQIPNVITPNSDGSNDYFVIEGLPEHTSLTVYNSSGVQVFHSDNYENNWPPAGIAAGRYYYSLILPDGTVQNSSFDVVY